MATIKGAEAGGAEAKGGVGAEAGVEAGAGVTGEAGARKGEGAMDTALIGDKWTNNFEVETERPPQYKSVCDSHQTEPPVNSEFLPEFITKCLNSPLVMGKIPAIVAKCALLLSQNIRFTFTQKIRFYFRIF